MAALTRSSSSPVVGCCCSDSSLVAVARAPQTVMFVVDQSWNAGQQLRNGSSYSAVGWTHSGIVGRGWIGEKSGGAKQQEQRRNVGVSRSAAVEEEEESFFQTIGTQLFKAAGGKKEDSKVSGGKSDGPTGTQWFGFGGKKKKEETEEPPPKSGTQLFNFGKKKATAAAKGSQVGGSTNGSALAIRKEPIGLEALQFGRGRRVDNKTVFVAGATGQIGARITQQLLRAGFSIRGGVPDLFVAQQLAEFATQYGVISKDEAKRLNVVEFDFKNVASIAKALGNAGKVVVTVGSSEDGPLGKVSRADAVRVLEAASYTNAGHFVVVSDPGKGVNTDNGPLAGLAALFNRVFSRGSEISDSELVDKIVQSDLAYTFIKAGSTDGVDDNAPDSGNLVVEAEGASDPSAKVSKVQVASVVAGVFQDTDISVNKFFEVTSSQYAPVRPVDELISAIQVDGRREVLKEEQARQEAEQKEKALRQEAEQKEKDLRARAEAEAQEAVAEARRAAQLATQLEAEAKRLAAEETRAAAIAAKAQAKAEAAAASVDGLQVKAKELVGSPLKTSSGRSGTGSFKAESKKPALSLPSLSFPKKSQPAPPVPAAASSSPKSTGFFGGLFAPQDTIYVDED